MNSTAKKINISKRELALNMIDNGLKMMKFASLGIEHKLGDKKNKRIFAIMKEPNKKRKQLPITNEVKNHAKYRSMKDFEEALDRLDEIIKTNNF